MDFDLPVIHVMSEKPLTVQSTQHVNEARALLASQGVHHLPVVEDGKLIGIISSSDIVKLGMVLYDNAADASGSLADDRHTVGSVMHRHPVAVGVDATVREAARILATGGFHSLPVVGYNNALKGIVTSTDLINMLIKRL